MPANVIATIRVPGFHYWPGAPKEVIHLADRHRHLFTFKAKVEVEHNDRDVEFQTLQVFLRQHLDKTYDHGATGYEFGSRSCEDLAQEILDLVKQVHTVEVWEDDENGAEVCR